MLRYLAIATLIVLTIVVFATAWTHRELIRIRIAPTNVPLEPKRGTPEETGAGGGEAFRGVAPWALSALPECLTQDSISRGTLAYVRAKVPAGATIVADGAALRYGPCTIFVRGDEVIVRRGADRLVVPPHVTLYRTANLLALLRVENGNGELRVYEPSSHPE